MGWLLGALLGVPGSQIALSGAIARLAGTRDGTGLRALQAEHQAAPCLCALPRWQGATRTRWLWDVANPSAATAISPSISSKCTACQLCEGAYLPNYL